MADRAACCAAVELSSKAGRLWWCSGESQGHEARAEQNEAAGSQCQEAIGYEVMVVHGTPAALVFDARPDCLKLSERAVLKEVMLAVRANGLRPSCGNLQTHGPGRSPRLPDPSVPKPSRSSLNSKSRPCTRENAGGLAQSKEFQGSSRQWGWSEDLAQQNVQEWHRAGALRSVDQRGGANAPFTIPA